MNSAVDIEEAEILASNQAKVDRFISQLPTSLRVSRSRIELEQEDVALLQRVEGILKDIEYRHGWTVKAGHADEFVRAQKGSTVYVLAEFIGIDPKKGTSGIIHGKIHHLLPGDTDEQIVETIFRAILDAELHEAAEWFRYKGEQPFYPHKRKEE